MYSPHEQHQPERAHLAPSERSFGLWFASVFAAAGLVPLLRGRPPLLWGVAAAAGMGAVAMLRPGVLRVPNLMWMRFGLLLAKVMNPLAMSVLFWAGVTPVALAMRVFGADPLRRKFDPAAESYWIPRVPPGPAPDSMPRQF